MTHKPEFDAEPVTVHWHARIAITALLLITLVAPPIIHHLLDPLSASMLCGAWVVVALLLLERMVIGAHECGRREGAQISLSQMSDLEHRVRELELR